MSLKLRSILGRIYRCIEYVSVVCLALSALGSTGNYKLSIGIILLGTFIAGKNREIDTLTRASEQQRALREADKVAFNNLRDQIGELRKAIDPECSGNGTHGELLAEIATLRGSRLTAR